MSNPLWYVVIAGLGFGVCPLLSRFSRLGTVQIAILVSMVTGVVVTAVLSGSIGKGNWTTRGIVICILAGAINSLGFVAYSRLISEPSWDLSRYVPATVAVMALVGALGAVIVFGESLTGRKIAGFVLASVAIWLLR